jgi:ATP-dependent protease ClpP protease subunit
MKLMKLIMVGFIALSLTGCATMMDTKSPPVQIEKVKQICTPVTVVKNGVPIVRMDCKDAIIFPTTSELGKKGVKKLEKSTTVSQVTRNDVTTFTIKLHDDIHSRSADIVINVLLSARAQDIIKLDIMSDGGQINSMAKILKAMRATEGTLTCNVNRKAASAAAVIAWSCPILTSSNNAFVLYHKAAMDASYFIWIKKRLTSNVLFEEAQALDALDNIIFYTYLPKAMIDKEAIVYWNGENVVISGIEAVKRHRSK